MRAVFQREFHACLRGMRGWVFISLLLLVSGVAASYYNFFGGSADILYMLSFGEYALIPAVPVLCMDSMARDRRDGTDRLLASLPVSRVAVVLGKYAALLCVSAIPVGVLCLYPLLFSLYGAVNLAAAYSSLLGFFLLCAGLIAVCQFLSSLTGNTLLAGISGVAALLILFFLPLLGILLPDAPWVSFAVLAVLGLLLAAAGYGLTRNWIVSAAVAVLWVGGFLTAFLLAPDVFRGLFCDLLLVFSPFTRFEQAMLYGLLDLNTLLLLLSVPPLFLYLTVTVAEYRRCR